MVPNSVAVLVYEGLNAFDFGIAVGLFGLRRPQSDSDRWYSLAVCGLGKGPVQTSGGGYVVPRSGLAGLLQAGTIVIPGWCNPGVLPPPRLVRTLRMAHQRGARLVSICGGAFVLAATGILNGRRATTHWKYCDRLSKLYPQIKVVSDVLYIDEEDVFTSAGAAAGIDLCLHIIRKDFGTVVANDVARHLVVSPHREGGQAQFIDKPVGEQADPWLAHLLEWSQGNLHTEITIEQLALQAKVSRRTLSRRFVEATGLSPHRWITSLRLRRGKDLLETTALSIEEIAEKCGFQSGALLRHHFREQVKISPRTYRDHFRQTPEV
ncbi:MAG: helix-turn-helix domain-containing protein [Acidobacteria bacterium]|nr:helix-turn-helix domain-containing protein [Acidobacteriota bacterium]